jgi:hypothetical protein
MPVYSRFKRTNCKDTDRIANVSNNPKSVWTAIAVATIAVSTLPCLAAPKFQLATIGSGRPIVRRTLPGSSSYFLGAEKSTDSVAGKLQLLSERLNLNLTQQTKVKGILEQQYTQTQTITNDASLSREDKLNKVQNVNEVTNTNVRNLLNDDQKDQYDKMSPDMRTHVGKGQGNGQGQGSAGDDPLNLREHRGVGHGKGQGATIDEQVDFLSAKLPLTQEQRPKIKAILAEQYTQIMAIYKNEALSRDEKTRKAHDIGESSVSKVRSLLNDDQKKSFDEMPQDMSEIIAKGNRRGSK